MKRTTSKLVAATPIAALALAASATAAPFQSRPAPKAESAPVEAAGKSDDACACTCAKCLEKHGPKAERASQDTKAKAPIRIEIMQSSEDGSPAVIETFEVSDHNEVDVDPPVEEEVVEDAVFSGHVEIDTDMTEEGVGRNEGNAVVVEEIDLEGFDVVNKRLFAKGTTRRFVRADDPEVADLAREVERILQTELEDITEEVIVEGVVSAASAPGAAIRVAPAPAAAQDDERGFLGVALEVTDDGVAIAEVMGGSPAEKAKFQAGDVLFAIGRNSITSMDELRDAMAGTKPGESIVVAYMRDGRPQRARVELAERESVVAPAEAARRAPAAAVDRPADTRAEAEAPAEEPREAARRRRGVQVRPGAGAFVEAEPPARRRRARTGAEPEPVRIDPSMSPEEIRRLAGTTDLTRAAQAENDARVEAVMAAEDVRLVILADGSVRITGTNVRVDRIQGRGQSSTLQKKLDVRIRPERDGSLIDWVRGEGGDRPQARDARPDRSDRPQARDARPDRPQARDARPDRFDRPQARDARPDLSDRPQARDARPDRSDRPQARDARPDRPDRPRARNGRPDSPQPRTDRADQGDPEMAALRRRIREMSAEIDRLSRQIQRLGRALGDR